MAANLVAPVGVLGAIGLVAGLGSSRRTAGVGGAGQSCHGGRRRLTKEDAALRSMKHLDGFAIGAADGDIGTKKPVSRQHEIAYR